VTSSALGKGGSSQGEGAGGKLEASYSIPAQLGSRSEHKSGTEDLAGPRQVLSLVSGPQVQLDAVAGCLGPRVGG